MPPLGAACLVQGRLDDAGINARVFHAGRAGVAQIVNTPRLAADEFLRLRIPFATAQKLSHAQIEPMLGFRKAAWRVRARGREHKIRVQGDGAFSFRFIDCTPLKEGKR
jgi:hypothetical protein